LRHHHQYTPEFQKQTKWPNTIYLELYPFSYIIRLMRTKVDRIKKSLVQILFFQIIKIDKTRLFKLACVFFVLKLF
jgi:hypothetical protein